MITRLEQMGMLAWIFLNINKFQLNPVGPYRRHWRLTHYGDECPSIVWRIRKKICEIEGLEDVTDFPTPQPSKLISIELSDIDLIDVDTSFSWFIKAADHIK